jgi:hypothetical protein
MLEKKFNEYGQEQKILSFDKLIKIGNKFLQVRLIETSKFNGDGFTKPMPRAKFVHPDIDSQIENPYYLIRRNDLLNLNKEEKQ